MSGPFEKWDISFPLSGKSPFSGRKIYYLFKCPKVNARKLFNFQSFIIQVLSAILLPSPFIFFHCNICGGNVDESESPSL